MPRGCDNRNKINGGAVPEEKTPKKPSEQKFAILRCPMCGFANEVPIPESGCITEYVCKGCEELIKAPEGTCLPAHEEEEGAEYHKPE